MTEKKKGQEYLQVQREKSEVEKFPNQSGNFKCKQLQIVVGKLNDSLATAGGYV